MEQIGALALPLLGLFIGALVVYAAVGAYTGERFKPPVVPPEPKPPKIQRYRFRVEKR